MKCQIHKNGKKNNTVYLNAPFGSRGVISMESRASKRQGPTHHGHEFLSTLVFIFAPIRPDIGRNWTSITK